MRYELAHDSLARQVLDRVSAEAKARRQAELLVARAYDRYVERQVLLTLEDLDEIRPHEKSINFSPEEQTFIQQSKNALARAAKRKRQLVIAVISLLSAFLLFSIWQWQRSVAGAKALRSKVAYENGWVSRAFRLAQSAQRTLGTDESTQATINEVLQDIHASGLERDLVHDRPVQTLDLNSAEEYLLSTTKGNLAYVWDLQGQLRYTLDHPAEVLDGGFIPWGETLQSMTIAADSAAYFWDGSGKLIRKKKLEASIEGFDFNARHQLTLLWTESELVLLDTAGIPWPFDPAQENFIQAAFSPNEDDLLIATRDSVSSWWLEFVKIGRPQPRLVIPGKIRWANYIASDEVRMQVLVQFEDSTSRVFNNKGQLDTVTYYQYLNQQLKDFPYIMRFDFSTPGTEHPKTLFQTDSTSIRYWSAYRKHKDGERAGVFDFYTRYDLPILNTTFSHSDRYLLTASADGRVDLWDLNGGAIERFKRFRAQIRQAIFARDNAYLITTAQDRTIKIWQIGAVDEKAVNELLPYYNERLRSFE